MEHEENYKLPPQLATEESLQRLERCFLELFETLSKSRVEWLLEENGKRLSAIEGNTGWILFLLIIIAIKYFFF